MFLLMLLRVVHGLEGINLPGHMDRVIYNKNDGPDSISIQCHKQLDNEYHKM
jgi:hypothetical protein